MVRPKQRTPTPSAAAVRPRHFRCWPIAGRRSRSPIRDAEVSAPYRPSMWSNPSSGHRRRGEPRVAAATLPLLAYAGRRGRSFNRDAEVSAPYRPSMWSDPISGHRRRVADRGWRLRHFPCSRMQDAGRASSREISHSLPLCCRRSRPRYSTRDVPAVAPGKPSGLHSPDRTSVPPRAYIRPRPEFSPTAQSPCFSSTGRLDRKNSDRVSGPPCRRVVQRSPCLAGRSVSNTR